VDAHFALEVGGLDCEGYLAPLRYAAALMRRSSAEGGIKSKVIWFT
jgi:hypothetical protein